MGQRVGELARRVERIAQWWSSATQEARYALLERAFRGEAQAPPLEEVRLAALLAEAEAGEISQG